MIFKGKKRNKGRFRLFVALFGILAAASFHPAETQARPGIDPNAEFMEFWGDYESIFLYHPPLVRQIFLNIIHLKGNRRTAFKKIDTEILTCSPGKNILSACRIDQLKLERKKRRIRKYYAVMANITSVTGHSHKSEKGKYILEIHWQPIIVKPPVLSIREFCDYLGIAENSQYYSINSHVSRIQINPVFENQVTVVTTAARAANIMDLYQNPPADLKDYFLYRADRTVMTSNGSTANFDFYLKAVSIRINHMKFETTTELLQ